MHHYNGNGWQLNQARSKPDLWELLVPLCTIIMVKDDEDDDNVGDDDDGVDFDNVMQLQKQLQTLQRALDHERRTRVSLNNKRQSLESQTAELTRSYTLTLHTVLTKNICTILMYLTNWSHCLVGYISKMPITIWEASWCFVSVCSYLQQYTTPRAQSSISSYFGFRFTGAYDAILFCCLWPLPVDWCPGLLS